MIIIPNSSFIHWRINNFEIKSVEDYVCLYEVCMPESTDKFDQINKSSERLVKVRSIQDL